MKTESPCLTCGACCSFYRVSFHWLECDLEGVAGPSPEHTVKRDHHQVCMMGTRNKPVRCIELLGDVGNRISCQIYQRRASPCRNFGVQMQDDVYWTISADGLEHCNEARAHFALPPLVPPGQIGHTATPPGFEPLQPKAA